jgi:hypothetical protein
MGSQTSTAHAPTIALLEAMRAEKDALDRLSPRQLKRYRLRSAQVLDALWRGGAAAAAEKRTAFESARVTSLG